MPLRKNPMHTNPTATQKNQTLDLKSRPQPRQTDFSIHTDALYWLPRLDVSWHLAYHRSDCILVAYFGKSVSHVGLLRSCGLAEYSTCLSLIGLSTLAWFGNFSSPLGATLAVSALWASSLQELHEAPKCGCRRQVIFEINEEKSKRIGFGTPTSMNRLKRACLARVSSKILFNWHMYG